MKSKSKKKKEHKDRVRQKKLDRLKSDQQKKSLK